MSDLIPLEGEFFAVKAPLEQRVAENKEKAEVMQSLPILDDLLDWFDLQAAQALTIENIDLESRIPVKVQIKANQEVARLLRIKKGHIQALKDKYKK